MKQFQISNRIKGMFMVSIASVLFGLGAVVTKEVTSRGLTAPTIVCVRGALSALGLLIYIKIKHLSLSVPKGFMSKILILSLVGATFTMVLLNLAYLYLPVGATTTIHYMYPIVVNIGGFLIAKHRPSKASLLALGACTIGVLLMFDVIPDHAQIGILFAVLSVFAWSFYMLYLDYSGIAENIAPQVVSFYSSSVEVVFGFLMGYIVFGHSFDIVLPAIPLLFLASLATTIVSIPFYQNGIKHIGAEEASILSVFEPISSIVFGALLLREKLSTRQIIASLIILVSITALIIYGIKTKDRGTDSGERV